jgi:hypothetical protein
MDAKHLTCEVEVLVWELERLGSGRHIHKANNWRCILWQHLEAYRLDPDGELLRMLREAMADARV